jgi:pyruvate formate lyase activating enzyme
VYGYDVPSEEIVSEIMKDLFFYQDSGGFTFSGGEPLAQPEFILDVFKSCAALGVRGTLETCLAVPWENVEPLLPYLDSIFVDVKHMSPEIHRELTGAGNALILDNIGRIDGSGRVRLRIRFPFIPGVNGTDENIIMLAVFCRTLKHLDYIEILPYHRLGAEKYRQLGLAVPLPGVMPPQHEDVLSLAGKLSAACGKAEVRVGGKRVSA